MHESICRIIDGQIVDSFDLIDGSYRIKLQSTRKRTLPQNKWLHAILPHVLKGLQDVGYIDIRTTRQVKAVLKAIFFKKEVSNGIETITIIEDTSDTDVYDFAERAEEIILWGKDYLSIDIAPPDKNYSASYFAEYDNDLKATVVKK